MLGIAGRTIWGAAPGELSLLHAVFYVASAGGLDRLLDTEGGAQQDRLRGGSQLVATRLGERLGERVRLGAPVRAIADRGDAVELTADEVTVTAAWAVLAVPPPLAARIAYEPALPAVRDQLTQRLAQGALTKCVAVYDEPFWRSDGLSGEALSDRGPVTLTFDNSPPAGRPGVLLGFVGGPEARPLARAESGERRGAVLTSLARLFGPPAASPERYLERAWAEEEWSRGGPSSLFPPGVWTACGDALRAPVGRIHWAGTETAERWCGFMDGAVRSGERAAREIIAAGV
jgi:monoamine oxidase